MNDELLYTFILFITWDISTSQEKKFLQGTALIVIPRFGVIEAAPM